MHWLYRTLHFMHDNSLPLPARIDFSMYVPRDLPLNAGVTYAELIERGLDDADAASGHARLHSVTFWSTPDGGGTGVDNAYPFAIEDYLPPPQ
jgi:hypothetical protein